jgi:glycosyltransferase involved in cell wall biosynthesis
MNILLVEPFFEGSHAAWAEGYQRFSRHRVSLLTLTGRFWKWRMHGGAVTLAQRFLASDLNPDLILASDMCDLGTFLALTRKRTAGIITALYFHENQLCYPWSPDDRDPAAGRDLHYGFINYSSALAADRLYFNSRYHMESFLGALPAFLAGFPDHRDRHRVEELRAKSTVLHLGLDLSGLDCHRPSRGDRNDGPPLVLWNHRWEYDKNPDEFFAVLEEIQDRGVAFRLAVLGRAYDDAPPVFARAGTTLGERLIHFGHVESREDYAGWLWRADLLPVTSNQDFFGASVAEAIHCGARPLLPRRLAYPELLPQRWHADCFYEDLAELAERLSVALLDPPNESLRRKLGDAVSHFDWARMAPAYDLEFEWLAVQ